MLLPATAATARHSPLNGFVERTGLLKVVAGSDVKADIRERQRRWLRSVLVKTGKSASELAENAGMADVTLTRFLNREDYKGVLSPLKIEQIKQYAKVPGPEESEVFGPGGGFAEGIPFDHKKGDPKRPSLGNLVREALKGRPNASAWILSTNAISGLGYRKGDIVVTDSAIRARAGDPVVAQVYDLKLGTAETVFRLLQPPYIVGYGDDPAAMKPQLVDDERVIVVGPITEMFRVRG